MILAVPSALCAWPAMKRRATEAAIGSFPLSLGSLPGLSNRSDRQDLQPVARPAQHADRLDCGDADRIVGPDAPVNEFDRRLRYVWLEECGAAAVAIAASMAGSL